MTRRQSGSKSFSLVEITLALGIVAISLLAVLGLMPIASNTNRSAAADTAAASIAAAVLADIRATPTAAANSTQFQVPFGSDWVLFFDAEGQATTTANDASIYRAEIAFPHNASGINAARLIYVKVSWPAAASPANAAGSAEMFCALNRNSP
jgi:uncharacterized protein (TIGR02598 family)